MGNINVATALKMENKFLKLHKYHDIVVDSKIKPRRHSHY